MSKVHAAWDARAALHRATMAIYSDLGSLVKVLQRGPNLRVALLVLDEHTAYATAAERGDPELVADLKHASGRLRASLATCREIRKKGGKSTRIPGQGGDFGGIGATSYHEAILSAAQEVLEPDDEGAALSGRTARPPSASGIIRLQVVETAMNAKLWEQADANLKHEYELAHLHPQPEASDSTRASGPATTPSEEENRALDDVKAAEEDNRLVTVKDAATLLHIPEKTIRNWINKSDKLQHKDRLGGPRRSAARFLLGDIRKRRPKGR